MYLQRTALASAILAVSTGVFANDLTTNSDNKKVPTSMLDQVTVSATRSERSIEQVAGSVSVITEQQLEDQLSTNISDAVRYEPGVEAGGTGRSGIRGFNIRGMDSNRVKIMVDGVDQSKQFDSGYTYLQSQRNFIDIDSLKSIEIVKGPASSLYGSDALGGIVAFTTKDPSDYLAPTGDDTYGSIKGQYNSAEEGFSETLTLANRTGKLDTLLVYTRRDFKETETHGGSNTIGPSREAADPMDTGADNILAKAQYQINENHRVGITTEYQDAKTDTDLKSGYAGQSTIIGNDGSYPTGKDHNTRSRIGIFHEWNANLALFDKSKWTLDWQNTENKQNTWTPAYGSGPYASPERKRKYSYSEEGYTLNGQFDKNLTIANMEHTIIYGLNVSSIDAESTNKTINLPDGTIKDPSGYMPKVDTLQYGLFIQDEIAITDRLTVTPGLRYDHYKYKPSTTEYYATEVDTTSEGKATGRLGAVYKLTEELSVFGQYSQGFKAPDYYNMYFSHGIPTVYLHEANPDLKPEEGDSWELGLRGKNHLGSFELVGFYNQYKNFIEMYKAKVPSPVPGKQMDYSQYRNLSDAKIKGLELKGQLWLDEVMGAPMGTSLRGSIAYAKGEGKQEGQSTKPIDSVAPLKAVFGLGYDDISGNWGGELAWTLVKGKSSSDVSDETYYTSSGYGIVDLTAYYKPTNDITLRGGVFNITDKKYTVWDDVRGQTNTYEGLDRYTQPGRNFGVSATWEF